MRLLKYLDLSACRYVTAKAVSILEGGKGIKSSYWFYFQLLTRHTESLLEELVLNKCGIVKLAGLNWVFPNLVRLEISYYFMANDGVIYAMARSCPNLEKLVLAGCHSIGTDGTNFL